MADEKAAEKRESKAAKDEGQVSTDPTVYHDLEEGTVVGAPTEPPRPDPTAEIAARYEDNASGEGPDSPEELAEKRVEARKSYVDERTKGEEEFAKEREQARA